jgi:phage terminase large subunit-like protein
MTSTSEIAAFALVFPPQKEDGGFQILPFFWLPKANLRDRVLRDGVPYDVWAEQGLIQLTEGDVIHYAAIRHDIEQLASKYLIQKIAYNRLGAVQLTQELEEAGILRVMADAMTVQTSSEGEQRPIRTGKTQGMTALIMALALATQHKPSVYESREVMVL